MRHEFLRTTVRDAPSCGGSLELRTNAVGTSVGVSRSTVHSERAAFAPRGFITICGFFPANYQTYQKIASGVFLGLGTTAVVVGYRVHCELARPPAAPSKRHTFLLLLSGLLFIGAIGCGLIGAVFLVYMFSGVP